MPRSASKSSPCAVNQLLPVLAGPWTLHILWVLGNDGPARFGELRRKVDGISARMLSERLRLLEERGFVYRHYEPTIPPAVTYGITDRMKDIGKVFEELDRLARKWSEEDSAGRPKHPTETRSKAARASGAV